MLVNMDTRFWGPSGWTLLHSLATHYPSDAKSQDKKHYKDFFDILPKVLPCCYCRDSLRVYYRSLPFPEHPTSYHLEKWVYDIHRRVNKKLRKQGDVIPPDPTFSAVSKKYQNKSIDRLPQDIWTFIYATTFIQSIKYFQQARSCHWKHFPKKVGHTHYFEFLKSLRNILYYLYPQQKSRIANFQVSNQIDSVEKGMRECFRLEKLCHRPKLSFLKRLQMIKNYHVG